MSNNVVNAFQHIFFLDSPGIKTYTVFAPINKGLPESQMSEFLGDSLSAKKFILKHIVPGALYSAGMRYYQVKESMDVGQKLKLYKEAGKRGNNDI